MVQLISESVSMTRPRSPSVATAVAPSDLEYTTDAVGGIYRAIRSWAHLEEVAGGVSTRTGSFVVVQRRGDPGHRFAQCSASAGQLTCDVGALDARTSRHTVWRLYRPTVGSAGLTAEHFVSVARDWLIGGVVPGYGATALPLDAEDDLW